MQDLRQRGLRLPAASPSSGRCARRWEISDDGLEALKVRARSTPSSTPEHVRESIPLRSARPAPSRTSRRLEARLRSASVVQTIDARAGPTGRAPSSTPSSKARQLSTIPEATDGSPTDQGQPRARHRPARQRERARCRWSPSAVHYEPDAAGPPRDRPPTAAARRAVRRRRGATRTSPTPGSTTTKTKVGYEIPLTRHFYTYTPPRPLAEIDAEIKALGGGDPSLARRGDRVRSARDGARCEVSRGINGDHFLTTRSRHRDAGMSTYRLSAGGRTHC